MTQLHFKRANFKLCPRLEHLRTAELRLFDRVFINVINDLEELLDENGGKLRKPDDISGSPRKIKSFFKNAFAPEDTESRVQEVFTSFKVYTFKYRSDPNLGKPSDWDILDVDKIGWLGDLMEMNVSYNDAFDASF